ncbi:MAG: family 20 glycosylhydrolase [Chitinophagaceae bacterium]|nr:family 20 glycosylhydrolase [Chitinophagaceae bacterium]
MRLTICLLMLLSTIVARTQQVQIIPQPVSLKQPKIAASFSISPSTEIVLEGSYMDNSISFFNDYLQRFYFFKLPVVKKSTSNNVIRLNFERLDHEIAGAYHLVVDSKGVYIAGDNEAGVFYGIQTLIQLLPIPDAKVNTRPKKLTIPYVSVEDAPRFAYRGLHLDVSRHFFPVSFIKTYIDYIALHKMNYFHWHLTDDQGWRIEIKKYPRLTSVGGWRDGTIIGRYPGTGNDNIHYGGFYTQEEIKEVVAYASKRYITVIPEIEMPGHSMAALAAYPQLGTTPDSVYKVSQTWGINDVFNNVLNPSEYTFNFLQDVLDEVMNLFPAPYIHIGGDECSKRWWHESPFCQQLMKEKGIKDEHALQSYFIQRIEKYVNSKSKKIIGWDEILEGGLAPNATVMSWRGEQGGIDAAKQNHAVIMTPGNPVYFDHTQSDNEDSVTIGGYNPIEKVYAYEPIPKELNEEQAKYVLGAQANMWTEYMGNIRKVEYMLFPRLGALSEVLWSPKEKKNWQDFQNRLQQQFSRYDLWKVNYSKAYFDLKAKVLPADDNSGVQWNLESKIKNSQIRYMNEISPLLDYSKPVVVKKSNNYSATLYSKSNQPLSTISQKFLFNKATGKKITLTFPASDKYPGDGAFTLVNGVQNEKGFARSKEFIGFSGTDCEALIDLGSSQSISMVVVNLLRRNSSWIWRPQTAEVFGSGDGQNWHSLKLTDDFEERKDGTGKGKMTLSFPATVTRYIKVLVTNWGTIPEGSPGAGNKAWLFVDEIEVN